MGWKKGSALECYYTSKKNRFHAKVRTNSKGLRDEEYGYKKNKNVKRILLLGDSRLIGLEVDKENVIDTHLEKLLNNHNRYEVINAGTRGYGTDQSYLYYKNEGYRYNPDIVIYLFSGNDTENNITIHRPCGKFGKSYYVIDKEGNLTLEGVPVPKEFTPNNRWLMSNKDAEAFYNEALDGIRKKTNALYYCKKPTYFIQTLYLPLDFR